MLLKNAFDKFETDSTKYDRKRSGQEQTANIFNNKQLSTRFTEQVDRNDLTADLPPELAADFRLEPDDVRLTRYSPKKGKDVVRSTINIHHISPYRNLDGLFANTTGDQAFQLQSVLDSGDFIKNTMIMPQIAHQGVQGLIDPVHTKMRNRGIEFQPNKIDQSNLHPIMAAIDSAHNLPFEQKMELAMMYKKEILPEIHKALDESLNDYYQLTDDVLADAREGTDYRTRPYIEAQVVHGMTDAQKRKELEIQEQAFAEAELDEILRALRVI